MNSNAYWIIASVGRFEADVCSVVVPRDFSCLYVIGSYLSAVAICEEFALVDTGTLTVEVECYFGFAWTPKLLPCSEVIAPALSCLPGIKEENAIFRIHSCHAYG